ncbi:MAG: polysaccharide biosynthesis tyrosine autokinase [Chitinophagaceae bacterium]|nr:polysaccharide biosynthesis tyrosine autokinase [Chitinophagaceae bacterium]
MQQDFEKYEEENLFAELGQRYLPYWPLFVILITISLGSAFVFLKLSPPIYEIVGKVLVKDEKKGVDASKVLDALNVFGEKKIVENEIDIFESWPILEAVVKDLNLFQTISHEENLRTIDVYGSTSPVVFEAVKPDSINKFSKTVSFTVNWKSNFIIIYGKKYYDGGKIELQDNMFILHFNPDFSGVKDESKYYLNVASVASTALDLKKNLKIESTSKQSTVIQIVMESTNRKKGEDIINTLIYEYQKAALKDKNQVASNTLSFVEDRLRIMVQDLSDVETNIEKYKKKEGIINVSEQSTLFLETVKSNDQKLSEINLQLSVLGDVEKYVGGKGSNPGTVPSLLGINDPTLVQLLTKLYEAEMQYAKLKRISGEKSDMLEQARYEINSLKPALLENIRNIRDNLNTTKNNLQSDLGKLDKMLQQVPAKEKALLQISREQAIKNSIYSFLLQKREETALSYSSAVSDSRIIEGGRSKPIPVKPIPKLIIGIGFALGLFSSIFIVIIREQFNRKILFRKEIEQQTGVPIVGELIFSEHGENPLVIGDGNRTVLAEQIRIVRTNLSYFGIKDDKKVILVTSSIPGEGKSFVSLNLAVSYALMGKKVALLELDMRKPKIAKQLKMEVVKGIANHLVGMASMAEITMSVNEVKGLYLLPSGPIPPNPSELITTEAFKSMIVELKKTYDYVIFDTPPVSVVTDAQLIAEYADATLYVVMHDKTPKVFLGMIANIYQQKKLPNMSVLFNGIKPRGFGLYGYTYGNGYGYGYGYTNANGYGYYTTGKKKRGLLARIFNNKQKS